MPFYACLPVALNGQAFCLAPAADKVSTGVLSTCCVCEWCFGFMLCVEEVGLLALLDGLQRHGRW
jgi:hypothetical protein